MLDRLIEHFDLIYGEGSFHTTSLRWRRIMVESADSSMSYKECIEKIKNNIEEINLS
jgi:hypothetical protein